MPPFYEDYIWEVENVDILKALEAYDVIMEDDALQKCNMLQDAVYEEGKWTIKEIFQHIIDNERIFSYRALRFARLDKNVLPGYDQNLYIPQMRTDRKSVNTLAIEFNLLRRANIMLFKEFPNVLLKRTGFIDKVEISVLAIGFAMVGHQKHHANVIKERYFPLLD